MKVEHELWLQITVQHYWGMKASLALLEFEVHFKEQSISGRKVLVFRSIYSQASTNIVKNNNQVWKEDCRLLAPAAHHAELEEGVAMSAGHIPCQRHHWPL